MTDYFAYIVLYSIALLLFSLACLELRDKHAESAAQESRFELLDPDNHEEVSVGDSNIFYRVNIKEPTHER